MKTLTAVLIVTILSFAAYPSVNAWYQDSINFKLALKGDARQACNNDKGLKWVKLGGSFEIFKCNELI